MSEPPSEKEKPILEEFREIMRSELKRDDQFTDTYLLRWLRARDLDLEKSALMLRNNLKWREANDVDRILEKPIPSEYSEVIDGWFQAFDRCGRPVICLPAGEWDVRPYLDAGHQPDLLNFLILSLEIIEETLKTIWKFDYPEPTPLPHTKFSVIFDLKHFSYAKFAHKKSVETLIELVKIYEANYPESLGRCLIINSPRIFSMLFAMIKPFLSENTVKKISIFDSNEKTWRKEVEKLVDPAQVPHRYGGIEQKPEWS